MVFAVFRSRHGEKFLGARQCDDGLFVVYPDGIECGFQQRLGNSPERVERSIVPNYNRIASGVGRTDILVGISEPVLNK